MSKTVRKQSRSRRRKAARIAKAQQRLLEHLASDTEHRTIHSRVGFLLAFYPHTRDSDIELCIYYWKLYYPEIIEDDRIYLSDLHRVEMVTSIVRTRQKIQNEFKLFAASEEVQERRQELAGRHRETQLEEKPADPVITVVCDETGKNGRYAMIGSVWCNDPKRYHEVIGNLMAWKRGQGIKKEFHFAKLKKQEAPQAFAFFKQALSEADAICIKAVLVEQAGIGGTKEQLFTRLHNQLCVKGLEHERDHGRTILPRILSLIKDADDGTDRVYLNELEQRLKADLPPYFSGMIRVAKVVAQDSSYHPLIQLADLFAGSLNRVLNHRPDSESRNYKDELADQILVSLGIDPSNATAELDQDFVMICRL